MASLFSREVSLCFLSYILDESVCQLCPAETIKYIPGRYWGQEKSQPSPYMGRSWEIFPLSHWFFFFKEQALCAKEFSPIRRVQEERMDVPDTHLCCLWGLINPAELLCVAWYGDVLRQAASKRARANSESSKAKRLQRVGRAPPCKASWCFNFLEHFTWLKLSAQLALWRSFQ